MRAAIDATGDRHAQAGRDGARHDPDAVAIRALAMARAGAARTDVVVAVRRGVVVAVRREQVRGIVVEAPATVHTVRARPGLGCEDAA
jgi:hypothetical protein